MGVGSTLEPGGDVGDVGDGLEGASAVTGGGGDRAGGRTGLAAGLEEAPALAARASFSAFANIILFGSAHHRSYIKTGQTARISTRAVMRIHNT